MRNLLLIAAACSFSSAEPTGARPVASWRNQAAFIAPSAWPGVHAAARGRSFDGRGIGLAEAATGGRRQATTLRGAKLVMMAKKVTKRPVSKGFGAQKEIKGSCVELKDAKTVNLMDWLKSGGASVSKVAIADFKGLRGVAARQVIEAGEAVVSIPQELALQLGTDGVNPGYAAVNLCRINKSEERRAAGWFQPFLDVLPSNEQCDTTDFFSEEELAALEWDPVVEETRERLKMLRSTYDASQIAGIDKEHQPFSWDEFLWGVYQVVSRVLTIYTDSQGGQKYLIPMIDMFNHDPKSVHELKCTQGQFKVIAGKRINEGEQINILYGGGKLNNDRLIQDYGFIQAENEFDKKQLTWPKSSEPIPGLPFASMGLDNKELLTNFLESFSTTLEEDEALLAADKFASNFMRIAVGFRAEKKRSIKAAIADLDAQG